MDKKNLTKIAVIVSGFAFLAGSVSGLSKLIGSSINEPAASEQPAQSQDAQLLAEEKGFLGVLQREPNNQTALKGLIEIRLQKGDVPGTKDALERLVKLDPGNTKYKEFLAALNKQIADTKKMGAPKTASPTQPPQPAK